MFAFGHLNTSIFDIYIVGWGYSCPVIYVSLVWMCLSDTFDADNLIYIGRCNIVPNVVLGY